MPPKSRAPYGSGAKPYQRPDGLWVARIEGGYTSQGTRRRITVSAKTEAECKRRLKAKQREILAGRKPDAGSARTTVKAWADDWLPIYRGEVKPRVYATTASHVHRWIVPTLGSIRLADLRPRDVRHLQDTVKRERSSSTAHHVSVTFQRMLGAAIAEQHHVPAVVREVKHPPLAVNDRDAIPTDDARRLLAHAQTRPDYARWLSMLINGMRQGESLGLTWDCADLDRGILDISWQLQSLPYADKHDRSKGFLIPDGYEAKRVHGAAHLVRPKTERSRRIIPLVPWLHGELVAARQTWQPNPWGLVWADTDTHGRPIPKRTKDDREQWRDLQAAVDLTHPSGRPYHLHEGRNTTATLLLEEGVDEAVIKAIMGHSSIVTSRGYMSVSQDLARHALVGVSRRLGAPEPALPAG